MKALLLPLMLAAAMPAAAQPADQQYRDGVAARLAGDNNRAVALLGEAVRLEPTNADAQLQLGLALLAEGQVDAAEAAFRRTLALAPDYADAHIGLARIAERRGDWVAALAALDPVDPANKDAAELRGRLNAAGPQPRLRLDLDLSYSDLEGSQLDWKEAAFRIGYQASPSAFVSGLAEYARRFGRSDLYSEVRLDRKLSDSVSLYVGLGGTPQADFRPELQISAGGSARILAGANPTLLTLDGRHARYAAGSIQTLSPGIEQYLAGGRVWLTGRWINIFDENGRHQSGWLLRADLAASPKLRLFAGASDAPDTSAGVVVETFSLFGGLAFDLSEKHVLRLSLAHEDRKTGSDRLQFGLGFGFRL